MQTGGRDGGDRNGRLFFRAKDPEKLKAWYREHLQVGGGCGTGPQGQSNEWLWFVEAGPMVFDPFKADSGYFPSDKQAMINLRVRDFDGLLDRLGAAGIDVVTKAEWDSPEIRRSRGSTTPKAIRSSCGSPPPRR